MPVLASRSRLGIRPPQLLGRAERQQRFCGHSLFVVRNSDREQAEALIEWGAVLPRSQLG